jgi:hypothetical protein
MTPLTLPERRPGLTIAAIGLFFTLAYTASLVLLPKPNGRILLGDALHHYVQLRSIVFDRDLQFQNEYIRMYRLEGPDSETRWIYDELTETGHVRNLMPVGPALLWAPAFLLVAIAVWLANAFGAPYPLDGYGLLFQAAAGITGAAAATGGVWLAYATCAQLATRRAAIWSCLTLWLGSSALYYSLISPTYSHSASMLAAGAFWYVFVRTRNDDGARRYVLLGALAGLAALMRWQDAILTLAVLVDLVWRVRAGQPIQRAAVNAVLAGLAALVVFTPQMVVWQVLYGRPLAIPQGGGFMHWSTPAIVEVLVSNRRGLLTWTPVIAAAIAGLLPLLRRDRFVAVSGAVVFAVSCYVNAAAADWWAGEAFGARRFLSCLPIFAIGLAALIDRWSPSLRTLALVSGAVVAHTFLLLVQYQAFLKGLRQLVPYPDTAYGLWVARFRAPFDLLMWWLQR